MILHRKAKLRQFCTFQFSCLVFIVLLCFLYKLESREFNKRIRVRPLYLKRCLIMLIQSCSVRVKYNLIGGIRSLNEDTGITRYVYQWGLGMSLLFSVYCLASCQDLRIMATRTTLNRRTQLECPSAFPIQKVLQFSSPPVGSMCN